MSVCNSRVTLDKLPDSNEFIVTTHKVGRHELTFIRPNHVGTNWTKDNLHFRSSVWDEGGRLVSAGFKKFFNLHEKPDIDPWDGSLDKTNLVTKLDGSLLILSIVGNEKIVRTRGSIDCLSMKNAHELEALLPKHYGRAYMWDEYASYLYEWQSPEQQIVIKHSKPTLSLIGKVSHWDYSYATQRQPDCHCELHGGSRPSYHAFKDKEDMIAKIGAMEGLEGCCLYYNNDQSIRKIKSNWYLKLHAFRSDCSLKSLINLVAEMDFPSKSDALARIEQQFDYECKVMAEPYIEQIDNEVRRLWTHFAEISNGVRERASLTQKDFALWLIEETKGDKALAGFGFGIRKGAELGKDKIVNILISRLQPSEAKDE